MFKPIDIQLFLPHREPMLMVDEILYISKKKVTTIFKIKPNNIFVEEESFFSETGLIENAAQTCSAIIGQSFFTNEKGDIRNNKVVGFISGLKRIKVLSKPKVNTSIVCEASLISEYNAPDYNICSIACQSSVEKKLIFDAEINLLIKEEK